MPSHPPPKQSGLCAAQSSRHRGPSCLTTAFWYGIPVARAFRSIERGGLVTVVRLVLLEGAEADVAASMGLFTSRVRRGRARAPATRSSSVPSASGTRNRVRFVRLRRSLAGRISSPRSSPSSSSRFPILHHARRGPRTLALLNWACSWARLLAWTLACARSMRSWLVLLVARRFASRTARAVATRCAIDWGGGGGSKGE